MPSPARLGKRGDEPLEVVEFGLQTGKTFSHRSQFLFPRKSLQTCRFLSEKACLDRRRGTFKPMCQLDNLQEVVFMKRCVNAIYIHLSAPDKDVKTPVCKRFFIVALRQELLSIKRRCSFQSGYHLQFCPIISIRRKYCGIRGIDLHGADRNIH
jgi:hypothetical protein